MMTDGLFSMLGPENTAVEKVNAMIEETIILHFSLLNVFDHDRHQNWASKVFFGTPPQKRKTFEKQTNRQCVPLLVTDRHSLIYTRIRCY